MSKGSSATTPTPTPPGRTPPSDVPTRPTLPPEVNLARKVDERVHGKYVRISKIGSGGMGEVWKAYDTDLQRWVALKFLKTNDEQELARFRREAQAAAGLNHPNICAVYEIGFEEERPFIAMQYVEGDTLQAGSAPIRKQVQRIRDAALAVHVAHEHDIIHRDIKPSNLMVDGSDRVYVMDFGLAKQTQMDSSLSASGMALGTPAYMSPEQAGAQKVLDRRTDIYSLGATLYDLLAGHKPFESPNPVDIMRQVIQDDPVPLRKRRPEIPRDLEIIVIKSMEKNPLRRYSTAERLAKDLQLWLDGEAIEAHAPSPFYRLRKSLGKKRGVVWGGVAGLLISIVVAGVLLPQWIREASIRREKERELATQKESRLVEAAARERAGVHLDAGRGLIDHLRVLMTDPDSRERDLKKLAGRAEAEFRKAFLEVPDHPEAYLGIVRLHALLDDTPRALELINQALKTSPGFVPAYLERARLRVDVYEDRIGTDPKAMLQPEVRALRALIEADLARVKAEARDNQVVLYAEALLAHTERDDERAGQLFAEYLRLAPADDRGHYWRGRSLYRRKKYTEAIPCMKKAVRYNARNWRAESAIANTYEVMGKTEESRVHYDRALKLNPKRLTLYYDRSRVLWKLGHAKEGLADLDEAIRLEPNNVYSHVVRGSMRSNLRDYDGAKADFRKALDMNPGSAAALNSRGTMWAQMGDYPKALADYGRAVDADPAFADAWSNRGYIKLQMGDPDGALRDYDRALELNPGYFTGYTNRGFVRIRMKDYAGAIDDLSRAIELRPGFALAYTLRGKARMYIGESDKALADFNKAIDFGSRQPEPYVGRGAIRHEQGLLRDALRDLRKALELGGPDWSRRADMEKAVRTLEKQISDD